MVFLVLFFQSFWVAKWLALPTLDQEVPGLNLAGGGIQFMIEQCFISQSLALSSFYHLDMFKIMLKRDVKHQTDPCPIFSTSASTRTYKKTDKRRAEENTRQH